MKNNKKKNLIICVEKNITKRDLLRFGIGYLSKFYNVDIVNFYYLIHKKKIKKSKYEQNVKNFADLIKLVKLKNYVCAIDYLRTSEIKKTIMIKKLFQNNKIKLVQVHNGLLPIESKYSKEKFSKIFKIKLFKKYILKILNNLFSNLNFCYDISMISGLKAEQIYPETKFSKKKIYTHSFDYEATLKQKKIKKNKNLAIFIDENLMSHPDYKLFGINLSSYSSEYYSLIRKTLLSFKDKYNLNIIVCVHPSLRHEDYNSYFKGFKCVIDKTEYYSRKASLAILHQSTAVSFSVIYKIPLVFLNYNRLNNSFLFNNINRMASLFNKKPYFIDDKFLIDNKSIDFKIDKKCYSKYLDNYIIHPKSNKKRSMWSLLAKELKK